MLYSLTILATATSLASCSSLSPPDSHDASSLASLLAPNGDGIAVGGWLRTRYANSSDVDTDLATAGEQDLGGFSLDSARLNFSGTLDGDWGFNASIEGGHQGLLDTGTSGVTEVAARYQDVDDADDTATREARDVARCAVRRTLNRAC